MYRWLGWSVRHLAPLPPLFALCQPAPDSMADSDFTTSVNTYDTGSFDVWGVQPYRGSSFGSLFQEYTSSKPLLISEFGLDAYYTRGCDETPSICFSFVSKLFFKLYLLLFRLCRATVVRKGSAPLGL